MTRRMIRWRNVERAVRFDDFNDMEIFKLRDQDDFFQKQDLSEDQKLFPFDNDRIGINLQKLCQIVDLINVKCDNAKELNYFSVNSQNH